MNTSSMTSGLDFTELPSKLWNFVLESISLRLTQKLKSYSTPSDSQIWTIIPNGATIQTTFDEIELEISNNVITVFFKASGMNLRAQENWQWTEKHKFEFKENGRF